MAEFGTGDVISRSRARVVCVRYDPDRDQNSLVLLSKSRFPDASSVTEHTGEIMASFTGATDSNGKAVPVADGDLFVASARDTRGDDFVFASFHGDTNGLATVPVVGAVHAYLQRPGSTLAAHRFVFGLDANTCVARRRPRRSSGGGVQRRARRARAP